MPIYEYECTKCHHISEAWQNFSDPPLTKCEKCKGKVKKLISHSAFHLKGTGWYVTDYAKKNSTSDTKNKDASPKKETSSKETKSSEKSGKDSSTKSKKKTKD